MIYSGRDLQKTNSYKTDAFKMGEFGSARIYMDDHVYSIKIYHLKSIHFRRFSPKMEFEWPKVEILMYIQTRIQNY